LLNAGDSGIRVLSEALRSEDATTTAHALYGVRQWLINLYGYRTYDGVAFPKIADTEVKPALMLLLQHREPRIRAEALTCLSCFDDEDGSICELIEECLQDKDRNVVYTARSVLSQMARDRDTEIERKDDFLGELEKVTPAGSDGESGTGDDLLDSL
jgi:hypothetical protein